MQNLLGTLLLNTNIKQKFLEKPMMPARTSLTPSNINHNFILAAMNPRENDLFRLFRRYSEALDWDWLLTFSQKKKIGGILIDSLNVAGITERLPRKTQNALFRIQEKATEQQKRAYNTLNQLIDAFAQEQIPFLVLKGSVFAEELYNNPSVRPFYDIDLLVHKRFLRKAEDVLTSIGYSFYYPSDLSFVPLRYRPKKKLGGSDAENVIRQLYMRYHFHFTFVLPWDDKRLPVDLHWSVFRADSLTMNFWEFTRELTIGNLHVRTLSVEATIVYLAYVIANKGVLGCSFLALCDFIRYMNSSKVSYDVRILREIVDKMAAGRYVKVSLAFANRLFNFDAPNALNRVFKNNFLSKCLLYPATYKPLLIGPTNRRTLFQKIAVHSLWDIALFRFPWAGAERLVSALINFLSKRNRLKLWH